MISFDIIRPFSLTVIDVERSIKSEVATNGVAAILASHCPAFTNNPPRASKERNPQQDPKSAVVQQMLNKCTNVTNMMFNRCFFHFHVFRKSHRLLRLVYSSTEVITANRFVKNGATIRSTGSSGRRSAGLRRSTRGFRWLLRWSSLGQGTYIHSVARWSESFKA